MSKNDVGRPDHLTQIKVKSDPPRVEIIDHFDKGQNLAPAHVITTVQPDGSIKTNY